MMGGQNLRPLALPLAILTIALPALGHVDAASAASRSKARGLQGKIQYCTDCHGASGRGYRGYFTMPRLAGQQTKYFQNQLRAFIEGKRENHTLPMDMGRVHGVSRAMGAALAEHFASLNPGPFGGAPRGSVAEGKRIFEKGVPSADVPACNNCHENDAKGNDTFPRLAGQLYPYIVKELKFWERERVRSAPDSSPVLMMQPIAAGLSESQISAVAAYLSSLR